MPYYAVSNFSAASQHGPILWNKCVAQSSGASTNYPINLPHRFYDHVAAYQQNADENSGEYSSVRGRQHDFQPSTFLAERRVIDDFLLMPTCPCGYSRAAAEHRINARVLRFNLLS